MLLCNLLRKQCDITGHLSRLNEEIMAECFVMLRLSVDKTEKKKTEEDTGCRAMIIVGASHHYFN